MIRFGHCCAIALVLHVFPLPFGHGAPPADRLPLLNFPGFGALSSDGLRVVKEVAYYTGAHADPNKHRLDLYLPPGAAQAPVLVLVHGGGWIKGDRNYRGGLYGNVGIAYARAGIAGVVISYRLSPGVKHPAHAHDVARALRWVRDHIAGYGGDPGRVALSGHSAGGHLTALVALDPQHLDQVGLTRDFIRAAIPLSGVYSVARPGLAQFARRLFLEPAFGLEKQVWEEPRP